MYEKQTETLTWVRVCRTEDVPRDGGACVKLGDEQIALFYITGSDNWYATQNLCPHKQQMAISRGMTGEAAGEPKVACPFHKKTFSLETGGCLSDPGVYRLRTYPVKTGDGYVFVGIGQQEALEPA